MTKLNASFASDSLKAKNEDIAWKVFKLIVASKRGNSQQRKFFDTVLSTDKEREMWARFVQSANDRIAREAARLANRHGVFGPETRARN